MGHRVAFVDDIPSVLESIHWIFRDDPFDIFLFQDPREVLKKMEEVEFAVVVADQNMHEMEGTVLLQQVKERWPDTIRIIMTGYTNPNIARNAINQGNVYRFISKPWNSNDMAVMVKNAVALYELRSENKRLSQITKEQNEQLQQLNQNQETELEARIKEIKENEEQHRNLEVQLVRAQKMEAIGTLAGGIAHDFNNILTTIIGNASLALNEVGNDDPLREELYEIKTAGERAAALTGQLLAFSRKQIVQPKILDLNELLTNIEKMLGRLIGEDVELLTILESALWLVETDPGQMEQVIMNLTINARDAMPKGGKLTVETTNANLDENYFRNHGIKEEQPGPYVMLAVSDTGSGMDKETQEHIFEPFFTTKGIGKGTGLGLSTVYGIVKQNNGFIWVYSEPGQGTAFKVYFPKVKGDVESEKMEITTIDDLSGSETVLLVEDDNSLRNLMGTVLKQNGYKVLEAENGEDALRISKGHEGPIDLMVTDVVMPKMSGKETVERLNPLHPQMKVIYMSGYTDDAIVHHGVLEPGLNFIEKPFTPEGLARKVREVLDK